MEKNPVAGAGGWRVSVYSLGMALLYAGIDEAGYGPMLGPLCVGAATIGIESFEPQGTAPDLWELLAGAVGRSKRDFAPKNGGKIPVADSKALKLSNQSKTKHPCAYLELGVLGFLAAGDPEIDLPATDLELFERLGVKLGEQPWYLEPEPISLPLGFSMDQIRIAANSLNRAMGKAGGGGVSLKSLRVRCIDESEFNGMIREHGSKGAATSIALSEHLAAIRDLAHRDVEGDGGDGGGGGEAVAVRIVADRQSGRQDYRGPISRAWPGVPIEVVEHSPRASRYAVPNADCRVLFMPEAEDRHLPVALASMAAKLVRELAMGRFNRYWGERMPELKPTAGYVTDARRWLHDTRDVVGAQERKAMVRLA